MQFSVIINTYNRSKVLPRAVRSVLDQQGATFELIVVDDGSTDDTQSVLGAISDPRLGVIRRANGGLCAARNTGLGRASGDFVVFLDDDDVALPGWLMNFKSLIDETVGVAFCAAERRRPDGTVTDIHIPRRMTLCEDRIGLELPGMWAARLSLLRAVGGYDERLTCSHQTELMMRLIPTALRTGWTTTHNDRVMVTFEHRATADRPMLDPAVLYQGTGLILQKHRKLFARDARARADYCAIYGVNAARTGRWRESRSALFRSAIARPTNPKRWLRVAAASIRPLGRRIWRIHTQPSSALAPGRGGLFLPDGYQQNPPASADRDGTPYWEGGRAANDTRFQVPVYRLATRRARQRSASVVMDIGCGSGDKLAEFFGSGPGRVIGVDQDSAIELAASRFPAIKWLSGDLDAGGGDLWDDLSSQHPDVTICADVIEHLSDPRGLLQRLHALIGEGLLVLSTPDRSRLDGNPVGPPGNPRHVREWTADELPGLVRSAGFDVIAHRHRLPRRYSPTMLELKRTIYRAIHRQAIPDRRSCQILELRRADVAQAGP